MSKETPLDEMSLSFQMQAASSAAPLFLLAVMACVRRPLDDSSRPSHAMRNMRFRFAGLSGCFLVPYGKLLQHNHLVLIRIYKKLIQSPSKWRVNFFNRIKFSLNIILFVYIFLSS